MSEETNIWIVIPVYNAEKYLKECLDSIKNQNCQNFTCIMVNDGSTDKSEEICSSYTSDNRFILISQKNKGVSAARNAGIEYAIENRYSERDSICFLDADDTIDLTFLELMSSAYVQKKTDLSICGWNDIFIDKKEKHTNVFEFDFTYSIQKDFIELINFVRAVWAKLYSLAIIQEHCLRFDEKMNVAEDQKFNIEFLSATQNYYYIPQALYNYYKHNGSSLTETRNEQSLQSEIINLKSYISFLKALKIDNSDYLINKLILGIINRYKDTKFKSSLKNFSKFSCPYSPKLTKLEKIGIFSLKHGLLHLYYFFYTIRNMQVIK